MEKFKYKVGTYMKKNDEQPMTLIIGAKCSDGIVLVSDRKVIDSANHEETYEDKLKQPDPYKSMIVGAAGFSNLFKQFNRKIPDIVGERLREIEWKNRAFMNEHGFTMPEQNKNEIEPETVQSGSVAVDETKEQKKKVKQEETELPFIYSNEMFIDDCKSLIKTLCTDDNGLIQNKLDVLLMMQSGKELRLHHINCCGDEDEVDYCAIGSGSLHINALLKEFWNNTKKVSIDNFLDFACFCIFYVQEMGLDKFVGVEENRFPDNFIIKKDGKLVRYTPNDFTITKIKTAVKEFVSQKDSLKTLLEI